MAMALYSAFVEDLDTTFCFFAFHEIIKEPRKRQYPVMDFLVSGQEAQSELEKMLSVALLLLE